MMRKRYGRLLSLLSPIVAFCFLTVQIACSIPRPVHAEVSGDLKQIEYQYYFRGRYAEAIEKLRAFLERADITPEETREAREYLAASLILSGSIGEGKDQFFKILRSGEDYNGPDPGLFKQDVVAVFEEAKNEYASMVIQQAPEIEIVEADAEIEEPVPVLPSQKKKPFYKKWWFYTTIGAVVALAAVASVSKDDGKQENPKTGTVTIGIAVH